LALDRGEWSASRPGGFTAGGGERTPRPHSKETRWAPELVWMW